MITETSEARRVVDRMMEEARPLGVDMEGVTSATTGPSPCTEMGSGCGTYSIPQVRLNLSFYQEEPYTMTLQTLNLKQCVVHF